MFRKIKITSIWKDDSGHMSSRICKLKQQVTATHLLEWPKPEYWQYQIQKCEEICASFAVVPQTSSYCYSAC